MITKYLLAFVLAFPVQGEGVERTVSGTTVASSEEIEFSTYFTDSTLRVDYVFCGDAAHQAVYLQSLAKGGVWAGRRHRLQEPPMKGNGQIRVKEPESGKILYANCFSSLFQEWQSYEEALTVPRAFENSFQLPFPRRKVEVELLLFDTRGRVYASVSHPVDPDDILIRKQGASAGETEVLEENAPVEKAIDIVFLSEGYTAAEKEKFSKDARRAVQALTAHEPFARRREAFNFRSVFVPSADSGPSFPRRGDWRNTVAGSHYDTFYSDRYLTSSSMQKIYDALGDTPFEHIILLVNTPTYGGGGILNSLTIMSTDHPTFKEVLVHEFGHAFGGLADEYDYGDLEEPMYPDGTEPWEPNITTLTDFAAKWQDLLPEGTPVPTPEDRIGTDGDVRRGWKTLSEADKRLLNGKIGVYEGAGYRKRGVYRPTQVCRMRINECEEFCPVCTRALEYVIDCYTDNF